MFPTLKKSSKKIYFICITLLLIIFFTGCTTNIPSQKDGLNSTGPDEVQFFNSTNGTYSINVTHAPIPDKILIYSTEKSNYSREWASSLAKRLGLSGKISNFKYGFINDAPERDSRSLTINNNTGVISFDSDMFRREAYPDKDKPQNLPSDEQAIKNVTEFLTSMNLMPSDAFLHGLGHPRSEYLTASNTKEVTRATTTVFFNRKLNRLDVVGSQILVQTGEDNDIISIFISWRNYTPYKEVPVKPIDAAFREFTTKYIYTHMVGKPDKIIVTNVSLQYYSQVPAAAESEKYLQPVYVFEGYGQRGNTTGSFSPVYIPATVEQFENVE